MIGRIVEIAEDGRHLSLSRGFLVVEERGRELGRVALDDIAAVIATGHGFTCSGNLIAALARRGIGLVMCGSDHVPAAFLWPVEGHHVQSLRMRAQLDVPRPLAKRLWSLLVRAKIRHQGAVLETLGRPSGAFEMLARSVRSGDPDNQEAQAARRYWPLLFGAEFRRDSDAGGPNALLNYGYAILRSATARAIVAAGLHPTLGIFHSNRGNPLCLVDDLMEPFRPFVDLTALRLVEAGAGAVTPETKRALAAVTRFDMRTADGITPLGACLHRLAGSLARAYEARVADLDLPLAPLPLDLAGPEVVRAPAVEEG